MEDKKYIIVFKSSVEDDDCYFVKGFHYDAEGHKIDSCWAYPKELAKEFDSIEEAQKEIDASGTIIPEQWIIQAL